jgi:hypothetical protein
LPGRIAEALQFDLLTRLQVAHLPPELQPSFQPCEQAQPRVLQQGKSLAQALRADVFLFGNVAVRDSKYDVSTYVSDAYELFTHPKPYTNRSVDLDNPSAAQMDPQAHAAVLTAVAAGLEKAGNCEAGITVTIAAERILGKVDPMIAAIRERCQQQLPHVDLLPGRK